MGNGGVKRRTDWWGANGVLWQRRRLVLGVWIGLLLIAMPLAAFQLEHLSGGGFEDRGSDSIKVQDAIEGEEYPGVQAATLAVVLVPEDDARPGDLTTAIREVNREVPKAADDVSIAPDTLRDSLDRAQGVPDRPVIMPLSFDRNEGTVIDLAKDLRPELGIDKDEPGEAAGGRVNVHVAGQGALWAAYQQRADEAIRIAEARAFPVIGLVLLLAFGSIFAMALPLAVAMFTVVITGAAVFLLSLNFDMSIFVSNVASMIGIGVAIDYALFILVRYREEIRAGRTPDDARAAAMSTSGRAVALAGVTVIAALSALFLIPSPGIQSMAVGAIIVVALSVAVATTLLVVGIGLLGRRAYDPGRFGKWVERRRGGPKAPEETFWWRLSRVVMNRPLVCVLAATALLVTIAIPAASLDVRNTAISQLPEDHEVRQATRAVSGELGPGALGPAPVQVAFSDGTVAQPQNKRVLDDVAAAVEADPQVAFVGNAQRSRDGTKVLLNTLFSVDPESAAARETVDRLRDDVPKVAGARADIAVGGSTAVSLDFDRLVSDAVFEVGLVVLGVSFLVLLVLLRSVVLPLKAILMNVLSIAAAYGVVVAVFQYGWLSFIGIDKAPSMYATQPFVIAVAFGLSMDYHVFLLSRIRERYMATGDNKRAVAEALASSAMPITSAALIMVAVFLAFVSASAPSVQQLGLAAAVAIGVDATIVRLVIVPSAMELLGKWNWWFPKWLDRLLPAGAGLEAPVPLPAPAGPEPASEPQPALALSGQSADGDGSGSRERSS